MSLRPSPSTLCRSAGCTLTGALSVTTHVRDAITIIHGPAGCTHHNFSLLHATSLDNDRITLPPLVSTAISETDVVFGGEGALDRTLDQVIERDPAAIFVLSTCITETIGDDVGRVCGSKAGVPVIVVPTAGFLGGSFQTGVNNALISLAGMAELAPQNGKVNIIGEMNLEYEVDENFAEVSRLLSLLGLSVNIRFVHDSTVGQIASLGEARLNVLRDPALVPVGEYLRERFGTPYIPGFPLGISGPIAFLESAANTCGIDPRPAIDAEQAFRKEIFDDFADIAGAGISFSPSLSDPEGSRVAQDMAEALRLAITPSGRPVPVPLTPPVGTAGVRRMLHRWRRAIHA
ncbi:nitrogenase component 1 [Methanoregula sp.]|uniref:nitrogenase component 1 n=1 Tax=Methanoregula sp. TaxID=2052170 RepID=UPI002C65837C|nr:nitrogenase component 1 [Methanoregula sp.]HVP97089.1 nitrogenase component 1 [Methanoregula sp.]